MCLLFVWMHRQVHKPWGVRNIRVTILGHWPTETHRAFDVRGEAERALQLADAPVQSLDRALTATLPGRRQPAAWTSASAAVGALPD
jgi:hypothetical protein